MVKLRVIQRHISYPEDMERDVNTFLSEGYRIYEIQFTATAYGNTAYANAFITYDDGQPGGSKFVTPPSKPTAIYSEPDTLDIPRGD